MCCNRENLEGVQGSYKNTTFGGSICTDVPSGGKEGACSL